MRETAPGSALRAAIHWRIKKPALTFIKAGLVTASPTKADLSIAAKQGVDYGQGKANMKCELVKIGENHVTAEISLIGTTGAIDFNATEMARQFGKKPAEWLKSKQAAGYINLILEDEKSIYEDVVKTVKGGKHQGTWLHKKLALPFARWLDVEFEYRLDRWIEQRIADEQQRLSHRLELKTGFKPLTEAILYAHAEPKPYHFSNECNLINRIVTGMDAKHFKALHGVDSVRDALNAEQMQRMDQVQRQVASLIELGFTFEDRKQLLKKSQTARLEG
ncbi:MAG: KilA-N domain-containing protein [Methylobacter sp.]